MEMIPKVLQAVAGQNRLIYIYFHDGTVRLNDASALLEKGGVFAPLRDDTIFRERLTVLNDTVPGIWMGTATLPPALTWTPVNYMSPAPWWKIP